MAVPRKDQSQEKFDYIAPKTSAAHGARNTSVLVEGRELPWVKKAVPHSIVPGYGDTPAPKHGTLLEDDGDGALLRKRSKSDKGSVPSKG